MDASDAKDWILSFCADVSFESQSMRMCLTMCGTVLRRERIQYTVKRTRIRIFIAVERFGWWLGLRSLASLVVVPHYPPKPLQVSLAHAVKLLCIQIRVSRHELTQQELYQLFTIDVTI